MESPVRTRMSTTARAFAARLDVVTRLVPARREPGRGSLAGEWHRAESRARGMARGDHAQCPVDGSRTHQTIRTLGSGGTRRAAPAPAGEPRAGTYGRRVSKSRSSLFVDRTAAQQLMPSRPGRRHGRSSRGRGLTGRREYVKRSCQRLKSLFCPLLQHDVLEERI